MIHSCDSYYSDLGGVDDVDYKTSSAMEMQSDIYRVDLRDSSYATLATCRVRSDGEYYHVSPGPAF